MPLSIRLMTCALLLVWAALDVSHVSASASANHIKRSVNFTPSWGKRSATVANGPVDVQNIVLDMVEEAEAAAAVAEAQGRCLEQQTYVEFVLYKLRSELDNLESCLRRADPRGRPSPIWK